MFTWRDEFNSQMKAAETATVSRPWDNPNFYAEWLVQTFYYVEKSTRIIALAAAYFPPDEEAYHLRFLDHLREERSHERLLMADIKSLQKKFDDFPEFAETASFYQNQYYWIQHQGPHSLFGYFLWLEGLAAYVGHAVYAKVQNTYGDRAANFLRVHVAEDPEHIRKALELVDQLSENRKQQVMRNFHQCRELYLSLLDRAEVRHLGGVSPASPAAAKVA